MVRDFKRKHQDFGSGHKKPKTKGIINRADHCIRDYGASGDTHVDRCGTQLTQQLLFEYGKQLHYHSQLEYGDENGSRSCKNQSLQINYL